MTHDFLRVTAIALGAAGFVSLSALSAAHADTSAEPAPTPSVAVPAGSAMAPNASAAPSLAEPAPTPGWAEGPPNRAVDEHLSPRRYAHRYARHYAWRNGHRYVDSNAMASAATGVVGGVADLGSLAAYPFYCFPNYGSCSVRWPHRY